VTEWTVRRSPAAVRDAVFDRDKGVCAECGTDTTAEIRERIEARGALWHDHWGKGAAWDADHIVPVWKGGGLAGLDGYQTLCRECHRTKTAAEAAERASAKRTPTEQLGLALGEESD
jgi:5-methylcytosine-specific restriction endonuclease McrA